MTGRALRDSVRIVTKFSEMEKNYSSLNSLRFFIYPYFSTSLVLLSSPFFFGKLDIRLLTSLDLLKVAIIWIVLAELTCDPAMMSLLMLHLKSSGNLKMDIRI